MAPKTTTERDVEQYSAINIKNAFQIITETGATERALGTDSSSIQIPFIYQKYKTG